MLSHPSLLHIDNRYLYTILQIRCFSQHSFVPLNFTQNILSISIKGNPFCYRRHWTIQAVKSYSFHKSITMHLIIIFTAHVGICQHSSQTNSWRKHLELPESFLILKFFTYWGDSVNTNFSMFFVFESIAQLWVFLILVCSTSLKSWNIDFKQLIHLHILSIYLILRV